MKKEALVIVDMSNDFVHDEGGLTAGKPAQEIVEKIVHLANQFLEKGNVIAFCMDEHEENDSHFELWPAHNVKGTWGQELYGTLKEWHDTYKNEENVLYIGKSEYDAFYNTNLNEELQKRNVDTVHVTGVCTDICDFLTVYGAYARGYKTVAYTEGTATFTENGPLFLEQMKQIFKTEIK